MTLHTTQCNHRDSSKRFQQAQHCIYLLNLILTELPAVHEVSATADRPEVRSPNHGNCYQQVSHAFNKESKRFVTIRQANACTRFAMDHDLASVLVHPAMNAEFVQHGLQKSGNGIRHVKAV